MGLRVAVANGNWSSPSTWYAGVKPVAGDIVASNGFNVTIDENVNVDSISNTAQNPVSTTIPLMTSDTTPSGVASSNSVFATPTYSAYKAFDQSIADNTRHWLSGNNAVNPWLEYQFPVAKTIIGYSIVANYNSVPNSWQSQAWDGSTWVTLDTVTGRTSNALFIRTFSNTTSYTRYRIYVTALNGTNACIGELTMFDNLVDAQQSVAGGGFVLNSGVTVTCTGTSGITAGNSTCLTYSGSGTSTINANINALTVTPATYTYALVFNGTGILNINGNLYANYSCSNKGCLLFNSSGTLNVVGNAFGGFCNNPNVLVNGSGTFNLVGDVSGGSNLPAIEFGGTVVATITGNLFGGGNSGRALQVYGSASVSITGNLQATAEGPALLTNSGTPMINIIGNLGGVTQTNANGIAINASGAAYIKVIGTIYAGNITYNFLSSSPSAINILTGPFISYHTGIQPFYLTRMHYLRTMGSYFEFRDNSTNGALPPAASAPATRLVSPNTVVDSPLPANVRYGTVYASGSLTGTMRVPVPGAVTFGVEVDNTVGTALLSAAQVWNYLRNDISVSGSIGDRLKNCATVESTGSQIASFKSS